MYLESLQIQFRLKKIHSEGEPPRAPPMTAMPLCARHMCTLLLHNLYPAILSHKTFESPVHAVLSYEILEWEARLGCAIL
jgi:hypothetical protein